MGKYNFVCVSKLSLIIFFLFRWKVLLTPDTDNTYQQRQPQLEKTFFLHSFDFILFYFSGSFSFFLVNVFVRSHLGWMFFLS